MHTAPHMCITFYIPRTLLEFFKAIYGHFIPRFFLLSFLFRVLLAATGKIPLDSCDVKQLLLIVFNKNVVDSTLHIE